MKKLLIGILLALITVVVSAQRDRLANPQPVVVWNWGNLELYGNINSSSTATVTPGTKTFYVTGHPYTVNDWNVALGMVRKIKSNGRFIELPLGRVTVSADTITLPLMQENFSSGDSLVYAFAHAPRAYDESTGQMNATVSNPVYSHYTSAESFSFTNLDTDTTYTMIDMASYRYAGFDFTLTDVTVRAYVTNDNSLATDDTTSWHPYSSTLFGQAEIADTETQFLAGRTTPFPYLRILFMFFTGDATNSCTLLTRKLY